MDKENCPCQSGKNYNQCCKPFLEGISQVKTPEQLMRSRYTAFATKNIDYIQSTMIGPALNKFNLEDAEKWTESIEWIGLKILSTSSKQNVGYVSFEAIYKSNQAIHKLCEKSKFINENGSWFYYDGEIIPDKDL